MAHHVVFRRSTMMVENGAKAKSGDVRFCGIMAQTPPDLNRLSDCHSTILGTCQDHSKTEAEWEERASAFLKKELKKGGGDLRGPNGPDEKTRLQGNGSRDHDEIRRGTFNATWFLAALVAIGVENVSLEQI